MICYRDMTFCSATDCQRTKSECWRKFDDEVQAAADEWWKGMKGGTPIAFSDFSNHCPSYKPPKGE